MQEPTSDNCFKFTGLLLLTFFYRGLGGVTPGTLQGFL